MTKTTTKDESREAFEAEVSKLPASMRVTIRESMERGESLSWHFWQAAAAWARSPSTDEDETQESAQ